MVEIKALTPDNLEFFTRACPTLPAAIYTHAVCASCSYVLSGEEIISGWFTTSTTADFMSTFLSGDTRCPSCNMNIGPELKILHYADTGEEVLSSIPLIRPQMLKTLLLKELKFLSVGSSPLLNIRLNSSLFWNMVWWFSMLNLPYQSIFGLIPKATARKPMRFRMPLFENWLVQYQIDELENRKHLPLSAENLTKLSPKNWLMTSQLL